MNKCRKCLSRASGPGPRRHPTFYARVCRREHIPESAKVSRRDAEDLARRRGEYRSRVRRVRPLGSRARGVRLLRGGRSHDDGTDPDGSRPDAVCEDRRPVRLAMRRRSGGGAGRRRARETLTTSGGHAPTACRGGFAQRRTGSRAEARRIPISRGDRRGRREPKRVAFFAPRPSWPLREIRSLRLCVRSLCDLCERAQKLTFIPISTFLGFWTPVAVMKKGDVVTPLNPVRFAWLVRLLMLTYMLSL